MKINHKLKIRAALAADFGHIQAIYADEVIRGVASFEEIPPSIRQLTHRWEEIRKYDLPFLVSVLDQQVVGFAYAAPYRFRPSWQDTVESFVYIDPAARQQGLGTVLMESLIDQCRDRKQMIAVVSDSTNRASIALHQSLDFQPAGRLERVGQRNGQWIDTLLFQRTLP